MSTDEKACASARIVARGLALGALWGAVLAVATVTLAIFLVVGLNLYGILLTWPIAVVVGATAGLVCGLSAALAILLARPCWRPRRSRIRTGAIRVAAAAGALVPILVVIVIAQARHGGGLVWFLAIVAAEAIVAAAALGPRAALDHPRAGGAAASSDPADATRLHSAG